jgi:AcrR family transcriptional regulator
MAAGDHNRQARKTRAALLDAFKDLVLSRRYADIRIADIIRRADVGRSTFYEHFRNKDDLYRQSLSGILVIVASAVGDDCDLRHLQFVLEHFRENGRAALGMLNGPGVAQVVTVLANLIEKRLTTYCQESSGKPLIPLALAAAQLAEAQLGLVRAWLNRGATCPSAAVAAAMHKSVTASARSPTAWKLIPRSGSQRTTTGSTTGWSDGRALKSNSGAGPSVAAERAMAARSVKWIRTVVLSSNVTGALTSKWARARVTRPVAVSINA